MSSKDVSRPLEGVKIIDLTSVVMGPYCTKILGDMGAEVIKIESLEGDSLRFLPPARTDGVSAVFRWLNRGKRSVVLNLKESEGHALLLRLAKDADVIIHSMRPQAIQALGLDYESIKEQNSKIIYCNLLGYGRGGCYFGKAAYDDNIQAISGMAMLQAERNGKPDYISTVIADKISGLSAVYAVTAALFNRERNGAGVEVDVPMFEIMASFLLVEHLSGTIYDPPEGRAVYPRAVTPERRPFATVDGYISVMAYNDKQWRAFSEITGRPELMTDPRFRTLNDRSKNARDWCNALAEELLKRTTNDWIRVLDAAGIPAARVASTDDLFNDPHLREVGFFQSINDAQDGVLKMPGPPVIFGGKRSRLSNAGRPLGADTRDVLRQLGLDDVQIEQLHEQGLIKAMH